MAITNTTLTTGAAASIFTSGSISGDAITTMYFCNPSTSPWATCNVFLVNSGSIADPSTNIVYANVAIAAGDTLVIDMEKLVLANGDMIMANTGTASAIIATVSNIGV